MSQTNSFNIRKTHYHSISSILSSLDDEAISVLLTKAKSLHVGIGGTSAVISIDQTPVFIKKIPLTHLELLPQNLMSTANIFKLPSYYQYGVGSTGFGAWRELAAHQMTTQWVLDDQCEHFPLLYHWRILHNDAQDANIKFWQDIESYSHYWENSREVRERVEALNFSTTHIALFLEYVPQNLYTWLKEQLDNNDEQVEKAIRFIDDNLTQTNTFMKNHGFIHFDAHFENILTDGTRLYLSDFGLALSCEFNLSSKERAFFNHHQQYDDACLAVNLLHSIISGLYGKTLWESKLQDFIEDNEQDLLQPFIKSTIKKYAPLAQVMDTFFQNLQKQSKLTPFPESTVKKLLAQINT